jgi:hypothetical protein
MADTLIKSRSIMPLESHYEPPRYTGNLSGTGSGPFTPFRQVSQNPTPERDALHKSLLEQKESWAYCNAKTTFHRENGAPFCPSCGNTGVTEQGYDHNHRHYCPRCRVMFWITSP